MSRSKKSRAARRANQSEAAIPAESVVALATSPATLAADDDAAPLSVDFWTAMRVLALKPTLALVRAVDATADRAWIRRALIIALATPIIASLIANLLLLIFHPLVPGFALTVGNVSLALLEQLLSNTGPILMVAAALLLFTTPLDDRPITARLASILRTLLLVNVAVQAINFLAMIASTVLYLVFGRDLAIVTAAPNPKPAHPTAAQTIAINAANQHSPAAATYELILLVINALVFGYTVALYMQGGTAATKSGRITVGVIVVAAVLLFSFASATLLTPLNALVK